MTPAVSGRRRLGHQAGATPARWKSEVDDLHRDEAEGEPQAGQRRARPDRQGGEDRRDRRGGEQHRRRDAAGRGGEAPEAAAHEAEDRRAEALEDQHAAAAV